MYSIIMLVFVYYTKQPHLETADSRENQKVEEEVIADVEPVMDFELVLLPFLNLFLK